VFSDRDRRSDGGKARGIQRGPAVRELGQVASHSRNDQISFERKYAKK